MLNLVAHKVTTGLNGDDCDCDDDDDDDDDDKVACHEIQK